MHFAVEANYVAMNRIYYYVKAAPANTELDPKW